MIDWIKNNYFELIGAFFCLLYLIQEVRQKWTMWIVGIISSIFYVYIFFDAKLYAEMGMYAYFAIMSVYGLYCWKFAKTATEEPIIICVSKKTSLWLIVSGIILFGITAWILLKYTDSAAPYADTLVAVLSILATWMVAKKYIEHWHVWIFTNIFATGLYIYQELYPTAVLFAIYSIMSVVGLLEWKKTMEKQGLENEKNHI